MRQNPSGDAHDALKEDCHCRDSASALESGKPDSFMYGKFLRIPIQKALWVRIVAEWNTEIPLCLNQCYKEA